jgi:hypothetical protein
LHELHFASVPSDLQRVCDGRLGVTDEWLRCDNKRRRSSQFLGKRAQGAGGEGASVCVA